MKAKTITMALAIAMASLASPSEAASYHRHARAFGWDASPAYWGVERRTPAYLSCTGWCWSWENPRAASVRQLDPRLRARSDGRLLEEVGTPPPPSPDNVAKVQQNRVLRRPWYAGDDRSHQPFGEGADHDQGSG